MPASATAGKKKTSGTAVARAPRRAAVAAVRKKAGKKVPVVKKTGIKKTLRAATATVKAAVTVSTAKSTGKAPAASRSRSSSRSNAAARRAKAGDELIFGIKPYKAGKREKYMDPRQREHFRAILLAWQQQLFDEVSRTVHHMQDKPENLPDPTDRASQETDITLELRNRDRERKLLRKIAASMGQLDTDEYGYCSKCGVEIGIRRLEVRPTATLCVDCKSLDEIRERQMA